MLIARHAPPTLNPLRWDNSQQASCLVCAQIVHFLLVMTNSGNSILESPSIENYWFVSSSSYCWYHYELLQLSEKYLNLIKERDALKQETAQVI